MKSRSLPSQDYLKERFDYDPETGVLSWKVSPARNVKVGSEAGSLGGTSGYRVVGIDGLQYKSHRLIWRWVTGEDPGQMEIDHIDRNRSNNVWLNLRIVGSVLNRVNTNKRSTNTSGVTGVSYHKKSKGWSSAITINTKRHRRFFKDFDDAVAWRKEMEAKRADTLGIAA